MIRSHDSATSAFPRWIRAMLSIVGLLSSCLAQSVPGSPTNIFAPASTPADSIFHLSRLVLGITAGIFIIVFSLLVYVVARFRSRENIQVLEPAQVYGSNRVELAWTVVPCLIVIVLFLATARVVHGIQDARRPPGTIEVTV
ncbi:MAG TPA: cytochrome c oxidase subunit II transmembrane domain-containing protein, partial [Terriglobales bacterium]|nr:cytochrome c oxidase subunit II transmembrane domain-containing protein [Terriglobales bacterium]